MKIFKTNEDGKEYIIDIHKTGDFFGYLDLIKHDKYTESAAAMEETEISLIPKEDFVKLLNANRDVASQLIKMLADNVSEKEDQLLNLAYNSVRRRVADAILLLSQKQEDGSISILRDDPSKDCGHRQGERHPHADGIQGGRLHQSRGRSDLHHRCRGAEEYACVTLQLQEVCRK